MKKKLLALLMTMIMCISLSACGASSSQTGESTANANDSKGQKVVLGINDWPGSYWWLAVDKMGYFDEQGVDVEVKLFSNYSDGLNALNSGKIDLFVPALADIIPAYVRGADTKVIMVQDYSAGADGLIAKSDIKSVKDLKGKNVAIELGGSDHLFLLKCLENAGLTTKDVNLINMSTGDASNAFISGQVDAAAIWEPSLSMAQKETGGNILASTKDAEYEGLIPAVLATNGNALKTKREEIKKVMKAWFNARDGYENKFDEFAKDVSSGAEVSPEEFKTLMEGCAVRTMDENAEAFKDGDTYVSLKKCSSMLSEFLYDNGLIDSKSDNFDSLFDSSIFDEVYAEMNK